MKKNLMNVIVAAAAGFVAGSAMGILFAPESGKRTRRNISKKGKKYVQKINDKMDKKKLTDLKKDFEEQLHKANEKIKSFADSVVS